MATKRCNVCQRVTPVREWTWEDVWCNWLRTAAIKSSPEADPNELPRRRVRVCSTCNHAMGVAFEDPASPLIKAMMTGAPLTLSVADQRALAGWATKSAALTAIYRTVVMGQGPQIAKSTGRSADELLAQDRHDLLRLTNGDATPEQMHAFVRFGLQSPNAQHVFGTSPFAVPVRGTYTRYGPLLVQSAGAIVVEAGIWGSVGAATMLQIAEDPRLLRVSHAFRPTSWPPQPMSPDEVEELHVSWNGADAYEHYDRRRSGFS